MYSSEFGFFMRGSFFKATGFSLQGGFSEMSTDENNQFLGQKRAFEGI